MVAIFYLIIATKVLLVLIGVITDTINVKK